MYPLYSYILVVIILPIIIIGSLLFLTFYINKLNILNRKYVLYMQLILLCTSPIIFSNLSKIAKTIFFTKTY